MQQREEFTLGSPRPEAALGLAPTVAAGCAAQPAAALLAAKIAFWRRWRRRA